MNATFYTTLDIMARFHVQRPRAVVIARTIAALHGLSKQGRDWIIPAEYVEQYQPTKVGRPKGLEMKTMVTRKTVDEWLAQHLPNSRSYEDKANGNKGTYRLDIGPSLGFHVLGKTWREVLDALKWNAQ